jgi:hypothetical protein
MSGDDRNGFRRGLDEVRSPVIANKPTSTLLTRAVRFDVNEVKSLKIN